jgi:hypothetical protein
MLNELQLTQFKIFGFVVLRGILLSDEITTAHAEFDIALANARRQMEASGVLGQLNWTHQRPDTPFLASLMEDERFFGSAKQLLGDDAIGSFARANAFSGDRTEWHPDVFNAHWRGIKFGFYLQPLDSETGALRLIPGSHKEPFFSEIRRIELKDSFAGTEDIEGLGVDEMPAFITASEPGDVVLFDNRTWHGSWGGGKERRMCTVGYFAYPRTPEEVAATHSMANSIAKLEGEWPAVRPHDDWINNVDGSLTCPHWLYHSLC